MINNWFDNRTHVHRLIFWLLYFINLDPCIQYDGMQHPQMKNKCCKKGCGEFCGGREKVRCQEGDGCCVGSLPNKKKYLCGTKMAPCILPGNHSLFFYIVK